MLSDNQPIRLDFLEDKIGLIQEAMRAGGIDMWITMTRECNDDPIADDLRIAGLVEKSAGIILADGTRSAVVGSFDVDPLKRRGFYHEIRSYSHEGLGPTIHRFVKDRNPKRIAVNVSVDYSVADGLTSGMREYLVKSLGEYGGRLVSSEDLVIALRGRLIPEEVNLVRQSISRCERIYSETEETIKVGMRDKEIHEFMKQRTREMNLGLAWEEDMVPTVMIGRNPPSHAAYYNDELRDGDFLRIDFGVKYQGYCSDIQRVYFVGKGSAPRELRKMFDTARAANDAAISALKPGVSGAQVDKPAREIVVSSGYPSFPHSTGHAVGRLVHEVGPRLAPFWPEKYGVASEKPIQENMVFTVEPSIISPLGLCNIEQDVLVTKSGANSISNRQSDLIQIG